MEHVVAFFRELPDALKLVVFLVLFFVIVGLSAWKLVDHGRVRRLNRELRRANTALEQLTAERDQLLARFQALDKVDSHVWTKSKQSDSDHSVSRDKRKTRFIAICNLKGGVGKTTLTLNLGVALAQQNKSVVLVDLDFQGTLSNLALAGNLLADYRAKGWTSDALLKGVMPLGEIGKYMFPIQEAANCKIILAREALEVVEFEQQSRFFVNPQNEVRYHLRQGFHDPSFTAATDYVLFDCPPRMSTACINALICADYVLVPTTLSQLDIEAVPRTLKWLRELRAVVHADFLGAVITRGRMRQEKLVSYELPQLGSLKQMIQAHCPGEGLVFSAIIPDAPIIHQLTAQRKAVAAHSDGRAWFDAVRKEFEGRIR